MTREDTKKLLEVLRVAYPNHYRNMDTQTINSTIRLYHSRFKDYPTALVVEALNAYIDENEYPPTIAGIKKYLTRFGGEEDYDLMFAELWSAICGNRKFTDLCSANQKYIGSQQVLDDMGMDERTIYEVVKGQYMKRIAEIVQSARFDRKVEDRVGTTAFEVLKANAMLNNATAKAFKQLGGSDE